MTYYTFTVANYTFLNLATVSQVLLPLKIVLVECSAPAAQGHS